MRTIEHFALTLPKEMPFYENEEVFVKLRHAALYDHRHIPDLNQHFIECSQHLTQHSFVSLLPGMNNGDGEKVLDIGLRCVSSPERSGVNQTRDSPVLNSHPGTTPDAP